MTTYRKQYYLKCGSMTKELKSSLPTFAEVTKFHEDNSPTNNEVTVECRLVEVPNMDVSRPGKPLPKVKRWLK